MAEPNYLNNIYIKIKVTLTDTNKLYTVLLPSQQMFPTVSLAGLLYLMGVARLDIFY